MHFDAIQSWVILHPQKEAVAIDTRNFSGERRCFGVGLRIAMHVGGTAMDLIPPGELAGCGRVQSELASCVIEYLRQHPQAMDTVSGIAEWWIPAGGEPIDLSEMRGTLEELTRRGVLEQVDAGEHQHYRRKRD